MTVRSSVRRWASNWGHTRFRTRLQHRAKGTNCEVIVQDEAYTSMTCSECGVKNRQLGSNELFACASCLLEVHRDLNGAINILTLLIRDTTGVV